MELKAIIGIALVVFIVGGFIAGFHTCEHIACYEVFPLVRRA